jgi:hypothetical protein
MIPKGFIMIPMNTATETAAARLATLGRVVTLQIRDANGWVAVDAKVTRMGRTTSVYAIGPTLEAALDHAGC